MHWRMKASGHIIETPSNGIHTLYISDQSRQAGFATHETIAEALTYLHRDGVLVLENVIEVEHLDRLRELLQPEAEEVAQDQCIISTLEGTLAIWIRRLLQGQILCLRTSGPTV